MAQISLPDTAVIDISVLQTIVNAINRHDDMIAQISTTYGTVPRSTSEDTANSTFNITTHSIQMGKAEFGNPGPSGLSVTIPFDSSFTAKPVVTVGIRASSSPTPTALSEVPTAVITAIETGSFTVKFFGAVGGYLHWIAIGDR